MQQALPLAPPRLPPGHRFVQGEQLGQGTGGAVFRGFDSETQEVVALKFIPRGTKITKYVEREILNQLKLLHPHVIQLKEVFLTTNHLVLAMELANSGNLLQHVSKAGRLPEEDARWFFQQIMFAVDFCHKMGVANRDLKLDNTLLQQGSDCQRPLVKLADFGFSKDENVQSAPGSRVGTPAYLAPEVVSNVVGGTYDGKKADVWSCGVMLFVMVTGRLPFQRREDQQRPAGQRLQLMLQRILRVEYDFPPDLVISEPCRDLIRRLLVADPLQRLSVSQVLQHPWTSQGLGPAPTAFNDAEVAASLAHPPPPEMLGEVQAIVREAKTVVAAGLPGGGSAPQHSKDISELVADILEDESDPMGLGLCADMGLSM